MGSASEIAKLTFVQAVWQADLHDLAMAVADCLHDGMMLTPLRQAAYKPQDTLMEA